VGPPVWVVRHPETGRKPVPEPVSVGRLSGSTSKNKRSLRNFAPDRAEVLPGVLPVQSNLDAVIQCAASPLRAGRAELRHCGACSHFRRAGVWQRRQAGRRQSGAALGGIRCHPERRGTARSGAREGLTLPSSLPARLQLTSSFPPNIKRFAGSADDRKSFLLGN
jgi:hypothetical protein